MATTTNFGWETPDDTDLVKDGAAAMRTLGNAIDTSLVDLKGGTTGQILSKASNTDLDYTWINNDQGDITGVTAGTGLTGGGTSGAVTLDYDIANYGNAKFVSGRNKIINGDFAINQRNFTSQTTGAYGFDRWAGAINDGTTTFSAQTFTPGTAPVAGYEAANFCRVATTGQTAAGAYSIFFQKIEDVRTLANNTVTVSFWAKAASGTPKIAVELTQSFGSGGSADVNTYAGQVTLSTSWARYSVSVAVPSISGKTIGTGSSLILYLWVSGGSNFNSRTGSIGIQTNTFDFWGIQVEAGLVASPFQTATGTIQGELAACQRYYWRSSVSSGSYLAFAIGQCYNTTQATISIPNPVAMRTGAASVEYANLGLTNSGATPQALTAFTLNHTGTLVNTLAGTVASGLVAGNATALNANNSTAAYIGFSAEL